MKYSIVIPCYNESENLKNLVATLKKFPKFAETEFILVENGSKDNSKEVFEKLKLDEKHFQKVYVKTNQGYGYGLQQGLKVARGEFVGWLHADLQVSPDDMLKLINYLENEADSSQKYFLKGRRKNRSLLDCFFTGSMTIFEFLVFGKKMNDIGAIPVLFNRELLKRLEKAPYDFSIELYTYYQAKKEKYIIKRFKVNMEKRKKGQSSWNKGLKSKIRQSIIIMKDSIKIRKGEQVK